MIVPRPTTISGQSKVRNWHNLMPNVATLKNAYRDRPSKQRRGRDDAEADDDHGGSGDEPEERK